GRAGGCAREPVPQPRALPTHSRDAAPAKAPSSDTPIESIHDLFDALRACWEPPAREQAQEGTQMSVRFSFKRTGEIIAAPFVTYATPGIKPGTRQLYRDAINGALARCKPLPFSKSFSAAIAGRPISIRYIDDRVLNADSSRP